MKKGLRVFSAAFIAAIATCGLASCKKDADVSTSGGGNSTPPTSEVSTSTPEVKDELQGISVSTTSAKTEYKVGETFSANNIVVKATYSKSGQKTINAGDYTVDSTKVDSTKVGVYVITISYQGKSTTYEVTYTAQADEIKSITASTASVKKSYEVGDTISYEGLSVVATLANGKKQTITEFTTKVADANGTEVTTKFTAAGTYTVTVEAGGKTATYDVTVVAPQYKQTYVFEAKNAGDTYTVGTKYVDSSLVTIEQAGYTAGTEDNTEATINGTAYTKAIQVKCATNATVASSYHITLKSAYNTTITVYGYAKKSGQSLILHDTSTTEADEDQTGLATVDDKAALQTTTFTLKKDHTYQLYNASTGGNYCIYRIDFAYSFDKSTVEDNKSMAISKYETEFDLTGENAFNFDAPKNLVVESFNNYGFASTVASSDYSIKVTKKNETTEIKEITAVGTYTVTVSINGTELTKSYDITVTNPNATIASIDFATEATTKKFYEGVNATYSHDGLTISAVDSDGLPVANINADEISYVDNATGEAPVFTATGEYTIKVTYKEASKTYTVNYYTIENQAIDTTNVSTNVTVGATEFKTDKAVVKATYAEDVTKELGTTITCKLYTDAECTTENETDATTAFAQAGTVYAKLSAENCEDVVLTLTVAVVSNVTLNAGDVTAKTYTSDYVINDTFTITASEKSTVVVEGHSKTCEDGFSSSQRIKLGGTASVDARSIKMELVKGATIDVYCISSSGSADRDVNLFTKDGTDGVVATQKLAGGSTLVKLTYTVSEGGTYYIGSASGGLNVYGVVINY